jgi:hypothetical protein
VSPHTSTEHAAQARPGSVAKEHPAVRLDALRALLLHESDLTGRWQDALRRQAAAAAHDDSTAAERNAKTARRLQLKIDETKRRRGELVGALRSDVMVW